MYTKKIFYYRYFYSILYKPINFVDKIIKNDKIKNISKTIKNLRGIMQNEKKRFHTHIPCTAEEAAAIKEYCKENGLIIGQVVRRLILKEIQEKSTILSPDFIPPEIDECLIKQRRK